MTNTLHENGHWVQENNLVVRESSTMEQITTSSSSHVNNQQEHNGTSTNELDDQVEDEDSIEEESINEEEEDDDEEIVEQHASVPYLYTGHLGTTSPIVLKHIDEAIDQVVNHYTISKSDLSSINSSIYSTKQPIKPHQNNSNNSTTNNASRQSSNAKVKRRKKKKKVNNNFFSFDNDHPFELDSLSANKRKKPSENKKKDQLVGPFIRVERKKQQTNYVVVNSSTKLEDKDNKQLNKPNYGSIVGSQVRTKSSNQILFKHNDNSWICVFCKRQPHYKQLGDLFGPHELTGDKELMDSNGLNSNSSNSLLLSSTQSPSTSSSHNNSAQQTTNATTAKDEVWFHEDCIIWSNGIYLAGNRVRNLDEVVLECSDIICCECKLKGANLGCVHKGCKQTFHFICAKESGCDLDEESFSMFCQNHKKSNDS